MSKQEAFTKFLYDTIIAGNETKNIPYDILEKILTKSVKYYNIKIIKDILGINIKQSIVYNKTLYSYLYSIISIFKKHNKEFEQLLKNLYIKIFTTQLNIVIDKHITLPTDKMLVYELDLKLLINLFNYNKREIFNMVGYSLTHIQKIFLEEKSSALIEYLEANISAYRNAQLYNTYCDNKFNININNVINLIFIIGKNNIGTISLLEDFKKIELIQNDIYNTTYQDKITTNTVMFYSTIDIKSFAGIGDNLYLYINKLMDIIKYESAINLPITTIKLNIDSIINIYINHIIDNLPYLITTGWNNLITKDNSEEIITTNSQMLKSIFTIINGNNIIANKEDFTKKMIECYKIQYEKYFEDTIESLKEHYTREKNKINNKNINELLAIYQKYVADIYMFDSLFENNNKILQQYKVNYFIRLTGSSDIDIKLLINKHTDNLLSGATEIKNEMEIEAIINKLFTNILGCIMDKDVFIDTYITNISKRLLLNKIISIDTEKNILSIMKKLNYNINKIINLLNNFQYAQDNKVKDEDYEILILNDKYWQTFTIFKDVIYPPEIQEYIDYIDEEFQEKCPTQRLIVVNSYGTIQLELIIGGRKIIVDCHLLQAAILIYLNNGTRLTINNICSILNLDSVNLKNILGSMLFNKQLQILNKIPMSSKLENTDVIEINRGFKPKMNKIKLPLPVLEMKYDSETAIAAERIYQLQAAIVRIMKARKEMPHSVLIFELINMMAETFRPDIRIIKPQIEFLIDQNYLERIEEIKIENGRETLIPGYKYLA